MRGRARIAKWQDLDVMQMAYWPNATRRWVLALSGLLMLFLVGVWFLWPRYQLLQGEYQAIAAEQQKINLVLQTPHQNSKGIVTVRQIDAGDEGAWLADWAGLARAHQLHIIQAQLIQPEENERQRMSTMVQKTLGLDTPNHPNTSDQSVRWGQSIGKLRLSVQGDYAHIAVFVQELGAQGEWLAIESVQMNGVQGQQVRCDMQLWYFKKPAQEVKNATP